MGHPVQKGCCHLAVTEHLRPFSEGQVGGDNQRCSFVELRDQVEQELAAALRERQVPQFIEYDQVMACQVFRQSAAPVVNLFLFQLVYQIKSVEESGLPAVSDALSGDCNSSRERRSGNRRS
jgi:hypothetical protein